MREWLLFLAGIATELYDLFAYTQRPTQDPEYEKQLAMRIVRKASDERARREIEP